MTSRVMRRLEENARAVPSRMTIILSGHDVLSIFDRHDVFSLYLSPCPRLGNFLNEKRRFDFTATSATAGTSVALAEDRALHQP